MRSIQFAAATRMMRKAVFAAAVCFAATLTAQQANAAGLQVVLSPSTVIGGSGSLGGTFNSGQYNATNILNAQTGPIVETAQQGFWLNPDDGVSTAPYITIDLGSSLALSEIELFNTTNALNLVQYGDRGTGNFNIYGSNSVTDTGGLNFALTSPTLLLSGTLNTVSPATAGSASGIPGQFFNLPGTTAYRYLEFAPTSVAAFDGVPCCGSDPAHTAYGLNELRVFTPEPGSLVLLGLGALGVAVVARRRRSA